MSLASARKIVEFQQRRSVKLIELHARRKGFNLSATTAEAHVLAHWLALIVVSSPQVRVMFKSHFMLREGQKIAAGLYGVAADQLPMRQATDFFREFCNLIGGELKTALVSNGQNAAVSLPIMLRGFDEIFYVRPSDSITSFWKLGDGESLFYCSTQVEVLRSFDVAFAKDQSEQDIGKVEFF